MDEKSELKKIAVKKLSRMYVYFLKGKIWNQVRKIWRIKCKSLTSASSVLGEKEDNVASQHLDLTLDNFFKWWHTPQCQKAW